MRILVVEDDTKLRSFVVESLRAEYYAVDEAKNGDEGSYLARTNDYDLIILDLMLPEQDGDAVCIDLRQEGKNTPILVLSAISDTEKKTSLLDSGADDYLTKPFELAELMARVRALLRRPSVTQSPIVSVRDVMLDNKANTVTRKGKEIKLTRKEFMLLEYFMLHPDTVLTRGMILEHVWDMSVDIFSNTIESHILSLRKKLSDKDKKDPLIKTIPGRGYKIVS